MKCEIFVIKNIVSFVVQIKELNLDNCRSTYIVGLTDEYVNLEKLSLINVGLTSLKGFPKLPNLKRVNTLLMLMNFNDLSTVCEFNY